MKYRIEIDNNGTKRYEDIEGDVIDIAVALSQKLAEGETYKKAAYDERQTGEVREGDKIILRTSKGETEFETVEEAQAEAAKLADDEGYDILSREVPLGSKATQVIEQRPSLKDNQEI